MLSGMCASLSLFDSEVVNHLPVQLHLPGRKEEVVQRLNEWASGGGVGSGSPPEGSNSNGVICG